MIGEFEVRDASGRDFTPRSAKARALLALLCRTEDHRRPRRWLEARLWSDRGQEQASGSLRQALTEVRKALGPLADRLTSDRNCVALENFTVDLEENPAAARKALFAGREFLEGIDVIDPAFTLWLAEERQRVVAQLTETADLPSQQTNFTLRLTQLPEGTEAMIARDLAAAIARLAANYLMRRSASGLPGKRIPAGLDMQIEGTWSEDRAYMKVRLTDTAAEKPLWSERLVARLSKSGRAGSPSVVFDTTEAALI